ncbi:hypothetical protein Cfor_12667, partial [Coptotermes formosanus]
WLTCFEGGFVLADDHHPPPTFTPPELPKKVHVRGEAGREKEESLMRNHRNTPTAMVNSMSSSKQVNKVKPTVNRATPDNMAVSPNQQPGGGGYN